jgi:Carbohydrate-selective porin, OprB family
LEAKTAELEANQFSTTTKLQGSVVAVISDVFSGDNVNGVRPRDNNIYKISFFATNLNKYT